MRPSWQIWRLGPKVLSCSNHLAVWSTYYVASPLVYPLPSFQKQSRSSSPAQTQHALTGEHHRSSATESGLVDVDHLLRAACLTWAPLFQESQGMPSSARSSRACISMLYGERRPGTPSPLAPLFPSLSSRPIRPLAHPVGTWRVGMPSNIPPGFTCPMQQPAEHYTFLTRVCLPASWLFLLVPLFPSCRTALPASCPPAGHPRSSAWPACITYTRGHPADLSH